MSERLNYTIENIKEIKQDLRELKAYIMNHMEEEHKNLSELRVDLATLKVKSSLWGSVTGALAAIGTVIATNLFTQK